MADQLSENDKAEMTDRVRAFLSDLLGVCMAHQIRILAPTLTLGIMNEDGPSWSVCVGAKDIGVEQKAELSG